LDQAAQAILEDLHLAVTHKAATLHTIIKTIVLRVLAVLGVISLDIEDQMVVREL
jgi:hypothetical protein